jgi:plastocyanin
MDLDGSIFWYFGGALVLAALVISFIGIRGKASFPPSGPAMWGVTAVFGVLVAGACAYGVANAAEEKEHREHEIAEEEAAAEEEVAAAEAEAPTDVAPDQPDGGTPPGAELQGEERGPAGEPTAELAVTSPEDGSLAFDPDGLEADAPGTITLAYANPSPVPHNIALEDEGGGIVAESDTVTSGEVSVRAQLVPGEYVYFCSVPGHREGGMEGTLTVDSDSATAE